MVIQKEKPIERWKRGEAALVTCFNINVITAPRSSLAVISQVSHYDYYIEVIDIGTTETIQLYGPMPVMKFSL